MRIQNMFFAVLNPVMRILLKSRFHRLASRDITILSYRGRKTNRWYETPLSYVYREQNILLLSSYNTRWWQNFTDEPYPVELLVKRKTIRGMATLYSGQSEFLSSNVAFFLKQLPRDASIYSVKLDPAGDPTENTMKDIGDRVILVVVELDAQNNN